MSHNVTHATTAAGGIARTIDAIADAARNTADGITEANDAINELAGMAGELRHLVGQLTTDQLPVNC